jgi:hypothetical protein
MDSQEDWMMRPVLAGSCKYESLIDGTLDLADVKRMNDALDIQNENQIRLARAERERK